MDIKTWSRNIDVLAEHFKVYAIDFWGLGYSTREPLEYGYDLYVEQLVLFMDSLGIKKASLIGHSMGGGTAIKFSLIHRDRVDKVVLVDATSIPIKSQLRAKLFSLPGVGEFLLRLNTTIIRRKNLEDYWIFDKALLDDDTFAEITQFQKIEGTIQNLLKILRKEFFHTLGSEIQDLAQMDVPILIVWGKYDKVLPLRIGEEMHRILRDSDFEVIENAGHTPCLERPELFNSLVCDFLGIQLMREEVWWEGIEIQESVEGIQTQL
jgi:pimeloyl-ACP methyl ester carboxylesterase